MLCVCLVSCQSVLLSIVTSFVFIFNHFVTLSWSVNNSVCQSVNDLSHLLSKTVPLANTLAAVNDRYKELGNTEIFLFHLRILWSDY